MKLNGCFQFLTICLSMLQAQHIDEHNTAEAGQFPFMAQITRVVGVNSTNSIFGNICGASLITTKWVLTAGQCFPWSTKETEEVAKNNSMVVIMGSISNLDLTKGTSRRFIDKIIRHPDFQDIVAGPMEAVSNDIAVAGINKEFILNRYIQTVSLASPSILQGKQIDDQIQTCTVVGFGGTEDREDRPHKDLLLYTEIELVSPLKYKIPTTNVFVSEANADTIKNHGDIGSPVMCLGLQFGLVSGLVTIDGTYVDMYTQIVQYEKFIKKHVPDATFRGPRLLARKKSGSTTYIQRKMGGYLPIFGEVMVIVVYVQYW